MNFAGAVPTGCSAIRVAAGYSHLWKCKGFLCLVKGRPCYMDWHIAVWGMRPVYNVNRLFVRHTIAVAIVNSPAGTNRMTTPLASMISVGRADLSGSYQSYCCRPNDEP